jgi:hypothetical protein
MVLGSGLPRITEVSITVLCSKTDVATGYVMTATPTAGWEGGGRGREGGGVVGGKGREGGWEGEGVEMEWRG